jgi:hypothetical protein
MDFPLVPSPTERTANPKLIYDFLFISQIDEFIEELSHHAKYHTFFMTSANSLESGYFSNQNKLYSMLALYKFFQKNNNGENREYVIARAALISEIQKIRFHVELLKKALSFGFQTFTDVRAALNNRQSPKIISYNENLG